MSRRRGWNASAVVAAARLAVVVGVAHIAAHAAAAEPAARVGPPTWYEATPPMRIVGPVHYVGTRELGVYLIATPAGHILIDGAMPESAAVVEQSIRTLGFAPEDIRVLLTTQAHADHVGTLAHFRALSGARVEVMAEDAPLLESGGRADYLFADVPALHFAPVVPDRRLRDGDTVSLGGVTLTARRSPGHTPGCTTWTTTLAEGGRTYTVVFPGSTSVNPGTRFHDPASYPGIADDYRSTFALLESLTPDIFLAAHAGFFDFEAKRARAATEGVAAFVDPQGYRRWLAEGRSRFEAYLAGAPQ